MNVHNFTVSSTPAVSAASAAELGKNAKYADIIAGVNFVPIVIETSGVYEVSRH